MYIWNYLHWSVIQTYIKHQCNKRERRLIIVIIKLQIGMKFALLSQLNHFKDINPSKVSLLFVVFFYSYF